MPKSKKDNAVVKFNKKRNESIDKLEVFMAENYELVEFPLIHRFTNGLYVREIGIPKGALLTSKIHKVQHQFFLLHGAMSMWNNDGEELYMEAPYIGITEANTRRVVYVWEDCVFATVHPNPENKDLNGIEDEIIDKYDNPLLTDDMKKMVLDLKTNVHKNSKIIDKVNKRLCQSQQLEQ